MTASLKSGFQAPSIEDGTGFFVVFPDILAIDFDGGEGWCFEVKDETTSKSKMESLGLGRTIRYGGGYSGRVWMLERRKFYGYLDFSASFECPCVIAIKGAGGWRAGFFTHRANGRFDHNLEVVAAAWEHPEGRIPIMFDRLQDLDAFMASLRNLRKEYWR